ncbi:hypothetical protein M409DRAFT_25442 [Zasmidium cellare ATCC 36951]|uniref:Uncharacterized protein n=1 Tax=Zasmidium cellare ATCC 36951 TaxID=1080233 RepID=A0A6A6CAP5_ZASCE|nr:uncharacterized protein M409DRAFT_25442 [Zasmidium cellare ATCC 36951]KAF2164095.1 hypothetical protein M409DRAFT_25442 [Zasmidium cellare ATCC 36951]
MFLEWIDQNSLTSSNASGKRRVRSQAMKNFRSRQRAERQAAVTSALEKAARRSVNGRGRLELNDRPHQRKKQRLSPGIVPREAQSTLQPISIALVPSSVPRSPSQWDCDPFESPAQIDQIIGFCASYLHQLRPLVSSEHATAVISTAWKLSPCPMLLAACSLAGAGEIQNASQPEGIYKAKVLHELRERMRFPETSQSDETISALMFLTSFDLSRANIEARTHLHALNDILKQKYGDAIPPSNSMMLETLDLIQALMFHTHPLTTPSTPPHTPSAWEMSELLSGLLTADFTAIAPSEALKLRGLNSLLRSAFAAVQATIINATMGAVVFETFYDTLEEFRRANYRDDPDDGVGHMARVCYHQHAILYNLVANGRPYRHPSNARHVQGLCVAIEADVHEPWRKMPFLRLMVLLTGLAASREAGGKAFFKARLVAAVYELRVGRWAEVREFVGMFLVGRDFLEGRAEEREVVDSVSPDGSVAACFGDGRERGGVCEVSMGDIVLDPDVGKQAHESSKPEAYRQRRVQELLASDRGFHEVIRKGNCWLTEQQ